MACVGGYKVVQGNRIIFEQAGKVFFSYLDTIRGRRKNTKTKYPTDIPASNDYYFAVYQYDIHTEYRTYLDR